MSTIIPDPVQPERFAINGDGDLLSGVRIRRIATPEAPSPEDLDGSEWEHVGWGKCVTTHENPAQPSEED